MIKLIELLKEVEDFDLSDNPAPISTEKTLKRKFEAEVPIVKLNIGNSHIKGHGEIFRINNLPNPQTYFEKDLKRFFPPELQQGSWRVGYQEMHLSDFEDQVQKGEPKDITEFLGITWEECMIEKTYTVKSYEDEHPMGGNLIIDFSYSFYIKGHTKDGDEVIVTPAETRSFQKPFRVLTDDGDVVIKRNLKNPEYREAILAALFPKKHAKPNIQKGSLDIRHILDFTNDEVYLKFRRIKRGGPGIKGNYNDLKKYLSSTSQKNLESYSENIKWDDMIIYRELGDTLFAVIGTDKAGQYYMYDRAGHGGGGWSKLIGPVSKDKL